MKHIFKSKTAALSFLTTIAGIASFVNPTVGVFITANTTPILTGLGVAFLGLRFVTKKPIYLFPKTK